MALGQVGNLGRPVVHLHVDVGMIIGMPRRVGAVIPEPLQFAGNPPGREQEMSE